MQVDLFDFELPEKCIALRPARPRDTARMMVIDPGGPNRHLLVSDLPSVLHAGDVLVVNDTKVMPAALRGRRWRDSSVAEISVTLVRRTGDACWEALARPAKRLKKGDRLRFGPGSTNTCLLAHLEATVAGGIGEGRIELVFDLSGPALDEAIGDFGHMPLPPYIASRRSEDEADRSDYQTMFAAVEGAIAAPTAGLHFTPDVLDELNARGVGVAVVTLHVGPGTFQPVKADQTDDHRMHPEWGEITTSTADEINEARRAGGRIVAVGTTSLRLLETAADRGGVIRPFSGETTIFITPGYRFRAVDLLITNFHLPRSTLFMLVAAFSGRERMLAAYGEAIDAGYRFYSYGDACLLYPDAAAA